MFFTLLKIINTFVTSNMYARIIKQIAWKTQKWHLSTSFNEPVSSWVGQNNTLQILINLSKIAWWLTKTWCQFGFLRHFALWKIFYLLFTIVDNFKLVHKRSSNSSLVWSVVLFYLDQNQPFSQKSQHFDLHWKFEWNKPEIFWSSIIFFLRFGYDIF